MVVVNCGVEQLMQMIEEQDVEVVMINYLLSPDGKICNNYTIMNVEKGSKVWFENCLIVYRKMVKDEKAYPMFGTIVYDEAEIKRING